jgi:UDP-glucuronate 4-epimerase
MKVLLTGPAGFIGMHVALRLLERGDHLVGVDNVNDYYDVGLKRARLACLRTHSGFEFHEAAIEDRETMASLFARHKPDGVVHLAAQAGVRYSLSNPHAYIDSNLQGFITVLEGCRRQEVRHLVYASSSSVYGNNALMPFSEHHAVDHPVSLYAATKKANELMAHSYSHLYRIPTTGLRFFTVYGPWGRPDMSPMLFADAIMNGKPLNVFNNGNMERDFTYIDDIVEGVVRVLDKPASADAGFDRHAPSPATSDAPYRIFNIGNSDPVRLMDFIGCMEQAFARTAQKNFLPMQAGDVVATRASSKALEDWIGFSPATALADGVRKFADWYADYHKKQ